MKPQQKVTESDRKKAVANFKAEPNDAESEPVCPYCKTDPINFSLRQMVVQNMRLIQVFCGNKNCRRLFGIEFAGYQQPMVVQPSKNLIV